MVLPSQERINNSMKRLIAKVNSKESLNYPVDGFILGILDYCYCFEKTFSLDEIRKIVNEHKDKEIFVSLNKIIPNSGLDDYKKVLKQIDDLDIKGIIVGDIAALTYGLKSNIILDQMHLNNSSLSINHYHNNGVSGVYLTNDITLDEINYIRKNTKAILFKQVFGLAHLSTSVRKLVSNYLGYFSIKNNGKSYFIKEEDSDNYYRIIEEKEGTSILSNKVLNLFDKIDEIEANYLVLDDFLLNKDKFRKVVNLFCKKDKNANKKIKEIFNTDEGFINKKTMYRVKNNE